METRPNKVRKPIMDCSDEKAARIAIEKDKHSVRIAREVW